MDDCPSPFVCRTLLAEPELVLPDAEYLDDIGDLFINLTFPQDMNASLKPDTSQLTITGYPGSPYPSQITWYGLTVCELKFTGSIATGPPFTLTYAGPSGDFTFRTASGQDYPEFELVVTESV